MTSPDSSPYPYEAPVSADLFARGQKLTPGGVNSPVRAFRAVGGTPRFMAQGSGPWLTDADGRRYVDLVCSWGPMILGHAHPAVVEAVTAAARRGLSASARPPRARSSWPRRSCDRTAGRAGAPGQLRHRGDDARGPAGPRLHRPAAGREVRRLLPRPRRRAAGRGRLGRRHPRPARHARASPPARPRDTIVLPYNDVAAVEAVFAERGSRDRRRHHRGRRRATWASSRRCPASTPALRRITAEHGALLIIDEVMTGFRVSRVGLVRPRPASSADLFTFGKVMGGGLPAAAFGGRADMMAQLAPAGPVYQAGTLSGNPVAVAAGLATLRPAPTRSTRTATRSPPSLARRRQRGADRRRRAAPACSRPASCSRSSSRRRAPGARTTTTPAAQDAAALHRVLPRDAGPRRLPAAVGVRGVVRQRRARRRGAGPRALPRCPRRGPRGRRGGAA